IDGKDFVESLYLEADLDCSTIDNHDGSVNFGDVRERNGRNCGGGNSAYKVFDKMSSIKPIEQDGFVREYYDVFVSFESTNKLLGQSCSKNVDLNSVGLDIVGCLRKDGNKIFINKEDNEVKQDSSVSDVSVTANNLDVSIVTNSDLTKPNEDFRKKIKDDVVIESNDENEVIANTGLMGFAEGSNENVNGKRMELRVYERDNNSKCVRVFDESCKEKMQDSSEIQEEKVYEDEEAGVTREKIDLGRLIHDDDDMKVKTGENVVSEFMVVEIDKFEGCVMGMKGITKKAGEGRCNSFVENKTKYGIEQDEYIKGLGKENTRNDISLMEMTTIFEKRKGTEVKKIGKRHGFGDMGYGDSLFPILGLDGYSGADGTELLTLNQIMQVLIQNFNMITINFDRTIVYCTVECLGEMERGTCDKMRNSVKKDGSEVHEKKVMGVWERMNWFIIGRDCVCSIGNVEDKILVPKPPKNYVMCTRCGYLVDGPKCQGCALLRQKLEENLVTHSPDFQNTSEPSNASTNVVNAPREPYVVKQDSGIFVDKIIFYLNRASDSPHLHTLSPNQFRCFHCKDVLRDGEACKRCTCVKCGSGLGEGLCYICRNNQNSLNESPRISETSSQSPPHINHCCYECDDPLYGIFCKRCTSESPFTLGSTPTYVDESPNVFTPPPQPPVYPCEFCGNDAYYGHYCTPQAPFIYLEPCYNQDFNFPKDFQNIPQQYPCCDDCGVTHEVHQCKPMNEVYDYGQNSCYDSTSIGIDQSQPQQYTVNHPIFNAHNDYLDSQIQLNSTLAKITEQMTSITSLCEMACQERSDSLDDNIISGLPPFSAITPDEPVLSTKEPDNSLSMGNEHLDTIPTMESDEFIKYSVETLIPIPSESEGILDHMCDVPSHDNSPPVDVSKDQIEDFSESNEEFSSIDDDSFSSDNIDYVEASPPPLNANPTSSSDFKTKSSSTSLNSLLEETNTFDNSLSEFETFCFDVEEISSGSPNTHPDISLSEYKAFFDDHVKEISSGSSTTYSDSSLYASFIFDLTINPFPPVDRSDFYEFTDELIPFISPPEYECFLSRLNPTRGISPRMWWRIFLQQKNLKFLILCPLIPPFN
nr:hypothetical protein [Tanacetum cinerariifolium]